MEYEIMGYNLSLRRSEVRMVEVVSEGDVKKIAEIRFNGTTDEEKFKISRQLKKAIRESIFLYRLFLK